MQNSNSQFQILVLSVLLAVMLVIILKVGEAIIVPIFIALISVYILTTSVTALGRFPVTRYLPNILRRLLVLILFIVIIGFFGGVVIATAENLIVRAPSYQSNLENIIKQISDFLNIDSSPDWPTIRDATLGRININSLISSLFGSISSSAGTFFLVIIYAMFLMGERGTFADKLAVALPNSKNVKHTQSIIKGINTSIGNYLTVKTLINVILAALSFAILWGMDVDYALFWALIIGLLNYIPYVGSLLGVFFPVVLTVVQFGSIQVTLVVALLLIGAQTWVGNVLEPKMIGKQVNLSPFVILVALSFWSALWGISGAILAIPLTAILAIIFAAFSPTRPFAVLLAQDVSVFKDDTDV